MEVRASSITEIAAQSDRLWGDDDISHFQSPGGVCGLESPLLSFMGEGAEEQQGPSYRQELIHTVISNASFFLQSGNNRVEICGLIAGLEVSHKWRKFWIHDGTDCIICLQWEGNLTTASASADHNSCSWEIGNKAIIRGRVECSFEEYKIAIDSIMPIPRGIMQECYWINHTIYLRLMEESLGTKCRPKNVSAMIRWETVSASLEHFFTFSHLAEKVLADASPQTISMLTDRWIAEGHIYRAPDDRFGKIPCRFLAAIVYRLFKGTGALLNTRYLRNCLLTDGYKISLIGLRTILRCLVELEQPAAKTAARIVMIAPDNFKLLPCPPPP